MTSTNDTTAAAAAVSHRLKLTAAEGLWGGPVYAYRGAEIRCLRGGHVCSLIMEGRPFHGGSFGVPGTITPLIDIWLDEGRLLDYVRAAPKC